MEPVETYKVLGPIAVVVLWSALLYIVYKWPRQKHWSFSRHAAASRHAFLVMAIARSIATPLSFLFMAGWFIPYFGLSDFYLVLYALLTVCDLISAWTPDSRQWGRLHKTMAYTVALGMVPMTVGIVFAPAVSWIGHAVATLTLSYMVLAWFLFFFVRKSHDYYLYFQGAIIFLFHLTILTAAFL